MIETISPVFVTQTISDASRYLPQFVEETTAVRVALAERGSDTISRHTLEIPTGLLLNSAGESLRVVRLTRFLNVLEAYAKDHLAFDRNTQDLLFVGFGD